MTTDAIIAAALKVTGITREQLFSTQRTRAVADCRKHVAFLIYRHTGATLQRVADAFGKSVNAVHWHVRQAASLYDTDPNFRRQHDAIVETLLDKKAAA